MWYMYMYCVMQSSGLMADSMGSVQTMLWGSTHLKCLQILFRCYLYIVETLYLNATYSHIFTFFGSVPLICIKIQLRDKTVQEFY